MPGVHSRARSFDAAAAAYERGRPGWPSEALEIVARRFELDGDAAVVDLAAGTGKLTRLLAARFATVTAVEPLDGMRAVLEAQVPAARALAGTAEAIPLPAASVDAVFVAEAIHWFDPERAAAEIARVLRPGGGVAVLYNRHEWREDTQNPWIAAVEEVLHRHRLPADDIDPHDVTRWRAALGAIGPVHDDAVEQNAHRLDLDGLVAMYASFSSIAGLPPDRREIAIAAVRAALLEHGVHDAELVYRTEITTARG
jgi:SAM-dependent methyltransferase